MSIHGIAYAEFHVEDVPKSAAQLVDGFGFRIEAPAAPSHSADSGLDRIALREGGVRLVLASAADPEHPVAEFVRRHGDGVATIAVLCDDAPAEFARAVSRGATAVSSAEHAIELFGDVALRFVQQEEPEPGTPNPSQSARFETIDHAAICIPAGQLAATVAFCERVLGFRRIFGEYIKIGTQAMDSIVVQSESGAVTFTLLEPDAERVPGQIDAFLASHEGVGVQHLAFRTGDIAGTLRDLGHRGVSFLRSPSSYYDVLEERLGRTEIPLETLRELNILVDQDHGGQLFQIFTRSVHSRRTFFFELIERRGASTFGTANIKALYEAVERQQAATSNAH